MPDVASMPIEPTSEAPTLFIKAGVPGAEPLDFYDELADRFGADLYATDDVMLEINGGHFSRSSNVRRAVRAETERRVAESLGQGINTVYEGFLNTFQRREEVRQKIAAPLGARVALLCVHAPKGLITQRLKERHARDRLSIPSDMVTLEDTLKTARIMFGTVEWPHRIDQGEAYLNLSGQKTINQLLREVARYLSENDLSVYPEESQSDEPSAT